MLYKEFQSQQARRMRSQEQARQPSEISCVLVDSQKKKKNKNNLRRINHI